MVRRRHVLAQDVGLKPADVLFLGFDFEFYAHGVAQEFDVGVPGSQLPRPTSDRGSGVNLCHSLNYLLHFTSA